MHWRNLIPGSLCATLRVKVRRSKKPVTTDYSEIDSRSVLLPSKERERYTWMDWVGRDRKRTRWVTKQTKLFFWCFVVVVFFVVDCQEHQSSLSFSQQRTEHNTSYCTGQKHWAKREDWYNEPWTGAPYVLSHHWWFLCQQMSVKEKHLKCACSAQFFPIYRSFGKPIWDQFYINVKKKKSLYNELIYSIKWLYIMIYTWAICPFWERELSSLFFLPKLLFGGLFFLTQIQGLRTSGGALVSTG